METRASTMMASQGKGHARSFIPALRIKVLTPLFDPFMSVTMFDMALKKDVTRMARLGAAMDVLDFGCGTGTLAVLVKQSFPRVKVTGLDVDKAVIAKARRKAARAGRRAFQGG